jgi:hypothetical protein
MKISDLSCPVRCVFLLLLLMISACGQPVPQDKPSVHTTRADAIVASFYKEVVARQPIAEMGDPKVFGPYFSKGLLHRFDDNTACFADWYRKNPGSTDQPPFGQLDMGVYSGGEERSHPQTFHIDKTESREDGSAHVYVKLTGAFKEMWHVAVVVVRENDRPVVDDVIYVKDKHDPGGRLSEVLLADCTGPRWDG